LYAHDEKGVARLRSALASTERMFATDDWQQFEREAATADCAVIVLEWLHDDAAFKRLSTFKHRLPLHPLILVTRRDADNVRRVKDVFIEEVIWLEDMNKMLRAAIQSARGRGLLYRLMSVFEKADRLPPHVRRALAYACKSEPPVTSVAELARATGCDRRTLWRHWHHQFAPPTPLRLEDLLHWLLLLRSMNRKAPGMSWSDVAAQLSVHEHTLGRLSKQLSGRTLTELTAGGQPHLLTLFTRQVLHPLLGAGDWDSLG
jgi:hypothetical protein